MKKITTKRDLGLALISLLGTILLLSLVWLGIGNKNIIRHDENAQINNKVRYVLVNEDNGATFNGKTYNLGGDFIKLVSRDTKHEWQTASYDMAEAGIKNGTYDVEVVIPENFSSRILALQSTAPKQAGISYRVRKGQNEVTNQVVGRNVDSMINYFNNRVVRMYFTSLVGNLRSAQIAMGTVANRQTSQVNDLASQVQQPFQGLNDQFSSLFSTASILDQDPLTDSQMTQDFSNNVRSLLQDLNQGLASGDDANTALNEELTKQLQRYDALNSQTSTYQLAVGNYLENGSLISSLSDTTSSFLKDTQANQASLEGQLQQLSEQYQVLRTLQQQLETEYGLTKTSQAENLAALKAKLTGDSSANTQVLENFAAQMKQSLANLPLAEDLTNDSELTKDLWNSQDKAQYQAAVKILTKYAKNLDSAYGTQKVTYLEKNSQQDNYTGTVTLNLTVGQTNTIKLNGDKVTGKVEPAQITQALTTAGYQNVVVSAFKNNQLTVSFTAPSSTAKNAKTTPTANTKETTSSEAQVETTEESPSEATSSESQATSESATSESSSTSSSAKSEESTETQPTTAAKNVAVSFNVDYQVDASTEYKWSVDDQVQSTGKFELVSQTDSTKLNQNVAQTIALAHEIKAVYGQSQSSLADFLANQTQSQITALPESLAAVATKSTELTPEVEKYADQLVAQYEKLSEQVNALGEATGQLATTSKTPAEIKELNELSQNLNATRQQEYLDQVLEIVKWYNDAQTALAAGQETSLAPSESSTVPVVASQVSDSTQLVQQYQDLQANLLADQTPSSATSDATTNTLSPVIQDLASSTAKLQQTTNSIRDSLGANLKDSQKQANANQDYAKAFNTVMQNARNGEADNSKVYNFLTNPIKATGSYTALQTHSVIPYFMTLIGALSAMVMGIGIAKYLPKRHFTKEEALIDHTRPWLNLPSVGLTFGISIVLGLIFALSTYGVSGVGLRLDWFIYTMASMTLLTSLITTGARLNRNVTLFIFSLVLGLYVLLTPFLGILVKAGSFVQILYRISPLQNIETGYAAIVSGGTIGLPTLIFLVLACGVIFGASLFLKPLPQEESVVADEA